MWLEEASRSCQELPKHWKVWYEVQCCQAQDEGWCWELCKFVPFHPKVSLTRGMYWLCVYRLLRRMVWSARPSLRVFCPLLRHTISIKMLRGNVLSFVVWLSICVRCFTVMIKMKLLFYGERSRFSFSHNLPFQFTLDGYTHGEPWAVTGCRKKWHSKGKSEQSL